MSEVPRRLRFEPDTVDLSGRRCFLFCGGDIIRVMACARSVVAGVILLAVAGCGDSGSGVDRGATADPAAGVADVTEPLTTTAAVPVTFAAVTHEFGKVTDANTLRHTFTFTNTGTDVLEIADTKSSCGCTVPALAKTTYAPGESGSIDVTWKPKGRGVQQQRVTVTYAGDVGPTALTIKGEIMPVATFTPPSLRLSTIRLGQAHVNTVTVTSDDPNAAIVSLKPNNPHLHARLIPTVATGVEDGFNATVEVTIDEDAPWGAFNAMIAVAMEVKAFDSPGPQRHDLNLFVHASVAGRLIAEPDYVRLNVIEPGAAIESKLLLTSSEPFELLSADLEPATLQTVQVTSAPYLYPGRYGYTLTLTGETGSYLGPVRGRIVIRTDVEGEEELRVQYAGMVRTK